MTATYTYDPFGRRIEKDVDGVITKYLYDGDQVIAEYDDSDTVLRKFIYGPGIDEPVKGLSPQGTVPEWYYHFDGLGSVTELTDQSGAVVEKYEYDAYGNTIIKDGNDNVLTESAIGNPYAFTGRRLDLETGLYFYRVRYYSPILGRFLQTDPIGYLSGINLYTYVGNNSITLVDPKGLCKERALIIRGHLETSMERFLSADPDDIIRFLEERGWDIYRRKGFDVNAPWTRKQLEQALASGKFDLLINIEHHAQGYPPTIGGLTAYELDKIEQILSRKTNKLIEFDVDRILNIQCYGYSSEKDVTYLKEVLGTEQYKGWEKPISILLSNWSIYKNIQSF